MRKNQKSVSKLLGIWSFLFLLLLKEAFPNAVWAMSTVTKCATDPACASVIRGSSRPAVAAAIANRNDEIGILVVPTGTFISLHRWSQGTTARAQIKAKEKYCATYPSDYVCGIPGGQSPGVNYYAFGTFTWQQYGYQYPEVVGTTGEWRSRFLVTGPISRYEILEQDWYSSITFYRFDGTSKRTPISWARYPDSSIIYYSSQPTKHWHYYGNNFKLLRFVRADGQPDTGGNIPPLPWKDWPQQKRNIAVDLLNDFDWQGLITSMPATPILRPGDPINIPTILIPGQDADNPNTLGDERQLRTIPGPYTPPDIDRDGKPDEADPDDDNDGTPDTTDPEPQNPTVPMASSDPPAEDTPSQGEQAVEQVREDYDDFLEKPENATYRDRLNRIKEKYRQAAELEDEAAVDIDAGFEQVRLIAEANQELGQLKNELGEAWWASLSQYEQRLFDIERYEQADINEMQELMKQWDKATFDDVAHNIVKHAPDKGYDNKYLEYLRDASNFDKSKAERIPPNPNELRSDGTVRWEIRNTGEYRIETPDGKIVTYGFNKY